MFSVLFLDHEFDLAGGGEEVLFEQLLYFFLLVGGQFELLLAFGVEGGYGLEEFVDF